MPFLTCTSAVAAFADLCCWRQDGLERAVSVVSCRSDDGYVWAVDPRQASVIFERRFQVYVNHSVRTQIPQQASTVMVLTSRFSECHQFCLGVMVMVAVLYLIFLSSPRFTPGPACRYLFNSQSPCRYLLSVGNVSVQSATAECWPLRVYFFFCVSCTSNCE